MTYLISVVETHRAESEAEAQNLISMAKEDSRYDLTKYNCEHKDAKVNKNGDITADEYWKITLTKVFNSLKEPEVEVAVNYEVE